MLPAWLLDTQANAEIPGLGEMLEGHYNILKEFCQTLHTKSCGLEFESAFHTTMLHLDISILLNVPILKERLNDWFNRKMRPDNWLTLAALGSGPFVT